MNKSILFCMLVFSLVSCERYEEIEADAVYKPKVVVASYLRGQSTTLEVAVTRSSPVFNEKENSGIDPEPQFIKDAIVTIQQGANTYRLTYDSISHLYLSEMPGQVKAGQEYELTVSSGTTSMKGKTTIPGLVNADLKLRFDSVLQIDGSYQYIATIICKMLDPGKHYIELYPVLVYADSAQDLLYMEGVNTIIELSGQESVTRTFVSTSSFMGSTPDHLEVIIVNADIGYAENSKRVLDLFGGSDISPFVEPAITHNNMSGGGIGSFGSFNPETRYYLHLK